MYHAISTGHRLLKLASNVEMFTYFFVFCWIKKKDKSLRKFDNEIIQPFLNLEDAPKCVSQYIEKKQQQKSFDIQQSYALSIWNDPHIR